MFVYTEENIKGRLRSGPLRDIPLREPLFTSPNIFVWPQNSFQSLFVPSLSPALNLRVCHPISPHHKRPHNPMLLFMYTITRAD